MRSTATGGDELASSESNAVTVAEADKGGKEEGSSEPGKGVKDKQDEISVLPSTTLYPGQDFAVKSGMI